ncbi:MAG: CBS domain-containing protein [Rhodocyclaceae bacterium]|nr:CBS domain-containing protein [Rhodocyclaceae bacterium]
MMKTIKQILAEKAKPLATVGPDDTVRSAIDLMRERDIGALLVVEHGKLVGIFTERDCLHKVVGLDINVRETRVREVMTEKVRYVTSDIDVSEGLALMTERFFRHLPVLDENENILGIVSIGDLVKARMSEQEFIIKQMEHYISSS